MTYVSTKLRCYSGIIRLYYEDEQFIKAWSFEDIKNTVYRWFSIEKREINVIVSNLETSFYHRDNNPYGRTESDIHSHTDITCVSHSTYLSLMFEF